MPQLTVRNYQLEHIVSDYLKASGKIGVAKVQVGICELKYFKTDMHFTRRDRSHAQLEFSYQKQHDMQKQYKQHISIPR